MTAYTIPAQRNWFGLILLGLAVGVSSGLFGIGGGIIVLPALVYLFGYYTRIAAGTSLLAVVLPAIVGVISYAIEGNLDLLMAVLLATGSIVGAPIGSWLLTVLPQRAVRWGFIVFMLLVIASLFVVIPSRDAVVEMDWLLGAGLVALGLFTGVMSGLLGIGGGVIIVPLLVVLFGASDLVAKGTSLLVVIATGMSGTVANVRRKNVDPPAALVIGGAAALATPVGVWTAHALSPEIANIVFAVFLALVIIRMLVDVLSRRTQ
ncbi:MAG TPA: sulfite exporter TauE/SafE family protein [Enteractinococcus helveticum]|uniref:Probable membrane transporter protein n=1 Tax=Enteractinococcus helveticum TaxID=1837282 RepID=A0A921FPN3_9MICC|nr:sulfite exporter TauE/SafE family protein [Enteractinococcus helveticum]HJF15823.1 sulfite exporter TauE/SafE family protein [Enteractinococcus helveticum]